MAVTLGQYDFDGPFVDTAFLQDRSGVYAVLTLAGNQYFVLDIGESAQVKTRIEGHDRRACWNSNRQRGQLCVAVLYTPYLQQTGRMQIEQELRAQYHPPCGAR